MKDQFFLRDGLEFVAFLLAVFILFQLEISSFFYIRFLESKKFSLNNFKKFFANHLERKKFFFYLNPLGVKNLVFPHICLKGAILLSLLFIFQFKVLFIFLKYFFHFGDSWLSIFWIIFLGLLVLFFINPLLIILINVLINFLLLILKYFLFLITNFSKKLAKHEK